MHRLEHRGLARVDVPAGGHAEAALQPAARSVMMSPNMLLVTITSNWRGSRTICMQSASTYMCSGLICGYSPLTSLNTRCHRPPAWVMAFDLSHIRTRLRGVPSSFGVTFAILESIADDPLHALARIDVFLDGDFVGGAFFEDAAGITIDAFGVFADDDEIDVFRLDAFQRAERGIQQAHRAHVRVQVHLEAHAQQDFFRVDVGRRRADRRRPRPGWRRIRGPAWRSRRAGR